MAGPRACRSFHWNSPRICEDELAGAAPFEGNGTPTTPPVVSDTPTPAPATTLVIAPSSNNKLFKQFMKAYLEAQVSGQTEIDQEPCKQLSRPNSQTFTMVICTWIAINFASSMRITSKPPGPKGQIEFHLQFYFCVDWSPSNGFNTNNVVT